MKGIIKVTIFMLIIVMTISVYILYCQKQKTILCEISQTKLELKKQKKIQSVGKDFVTVIDGIPHINLNIKTNYEKINDYFSNKINEISINSLILKKQNDSKIYDLYNAKNEFKTIIEVEDGYVLAFKQEQEEHKFGKPYIKKIDLTGKEQWKLTIDKVLENFKISYLKQLNNRSIIIGFARYDPMSLLFSGKQVQDKNYLVCISQKGKVLWKKDFTETCKSVIQHILISDKDELLCIGVYNTLNPPKSERAYYRDIMIIKLDNKGTIMKQRVFGGSNYDNVRSVVYNKELGLLIEGITQSTDGDFNREQVGIREFIARLDSELNTIWYRLSNNTNTYNEALLISGKYLYVSKHVRYSRGNAIISLDKYNKDGDILCSVKDELYQKRLLDKIILPNGNYLVICSNGKKHKCDLLIYNNQAVKRYSLKYIPREIIPTIDGGFILKSVRNIKTVPQPCNISCPYYDTEIIIEKYNNEYKLEWRKSYDHYQDKLGTDFVLPLPSGKVIVQ